MYKHDQTEYIAEIITSFVIDLIPLLRQFNKLMYHLFASIRKKFVYRRS